MDTSLATGTTAPCGPDGGGQRPVLQRARGDAVGVAVAVGRTQPTPTITWPTPAGITYGTALTRDAARRDGERAGDLHLLAGGGHGAEGGDRHAVGHLHPHRHRPTTRPRRRRRRSRWRRRRRRSPGRARRGSSTARRCPRRSSTRRRAWRGPSPTRRRRAPVPEAGTRHPVGRPSPPPTPPTTRPRRPTTTHRRVSQATPTITWADSRRDHRTARR